MFEIGIWFYVEEVSGWFAESYILFLLFMNFIFSWTYCIYFLLAESSGEGEGFTTDIGIILFVLLCIVVVGAGTGIEFGSSFGDELDELKWGCELGIDHIYDLCSSLVCFL